MENTNAIPLVIEVLGNLAHGVLRRVAHFVQCCPTFPSKVAWLHTWGELHNLALPILKENYQRHAVPVICWIVNEPRHAARARRTSETLLHEREHDGSFALIFR